MNRSQRRHPERWARVAGFTPSPRGRPPVGAGKVHHNMANMSPASCGVVHRLRALGKPAAFRVLKEYVKNGIDRVELLYFTKGIKNFRAVTD